MKILLVVSNYNEETSIQKTIIDIKENLSILCDILIIDNCSSDKSLKIIKESKLDYLIHPVNTGGSSGVIKTAFAYSDYNEYDIYCHMDGDNQHNASELYKLIDPIIENRFDIVIGSRFIEREGFQSHFIRRIGINLFSRILTKLTASKLTDITSGFRAYNKNAITYFAKQNKHELEASIQMLLLASYAGLKIGEVPVLMKPRESGISELNLKNSIKFPIYGLISLLGTLLQKK